MISTLELKQFRGLEHVKFENLGRVNLIIGGNNTGKTSILEALVLLYGNKQQLRELPITFRVLPKGFEDIEQTFWRLIARGGMPDELSLQADDHKIEGSFKGQRWSLNAFNPILDIYFPMIRGDASGQPTVDQAGPGNDPLSVIATKQEDPGDISDLFTQIAPLNPENENKLEELLRNSIEPRLRRLRYAKPQGNHNHLVYVDLGEGSMLPFTQLGQAFARTLQIYCEIFANRPKILLIDEIENGLYYEGMEDFWKGLMAVLEDQDVQLFATTHSRECMEAAHKAAVAMGGDPLRFLRLDRRVDDPGKIVATTFGKDEMQTAIEFNREMR
jgi:hypothetical protein